MRHVLALLASLALLVALAPATATAAPPTSEGDSWIVRLRPGVDAGPVGQALARQEGGSVGRVYRHAINGFTFRGSAGAAQALGRSPLVASVEPNAEVRLEDTQTGATWGIDRIDQRTLPLSGSYTYQRTGAGVTAYVIDSGIRTSHQEFGGRASLGIDLVNDGQQDCNGHGTHVAGTIGGATYGVAKAVSLVSVRVFGCSGNTTWDIIIAGIDWIIANHTSGPAVANMSLSGGVNSAIDAATNALINDGVATSVAAGNGNILGWQANACNYSPARVAAAMTVSATDNTDRKASWANFGDCVDWFAPGVAITSASNGSDTGTALYSGTSMASPHAAGVAALYLEANPGASPGAVRDAIFANTTKDAVTSSSTSNNDLLYTGFISGGGSPEPAPAAPSGLTATAVSASRIDLAWTDNATSELGFRIERATGGGAFTEIATVGPNVTGYSNTGLTASTTFDYRVRAYGSGGDSAYSDPASATTLPPPPVPTCVAPLILTHSDTNASRGGTVSFTWSPVQGATQYRVQRQSGGSSWSTRQTSSATSFTGSDASSDPNWRVFVYQGTCTPIPGPATVFDP
jgi:subtilisin family serine protease